MKTIYPLKKGEPANIVQPLVRYLEQNDSPGAGLAIRDTLGQINQLRSKIVTLQLPGQPSIESVDKYIQVYEMYIRYSRLIAKHFNWNPEYGNCVENFNITWSDSFNNQIKFTKPEIHFDIFSCYYNLGILYFYKAQAKCTQQFLNSKKEAIQFGKRSFYFFNQMRTVYYSGFTNTGFSDTSYPHLEMLQCLSLGIVYKSMFDMFKQDEYKHGINKIGSLAVLAQQNFYKAYQIGVQFFMKSSNISNNIRSQLLSFAYVQSLYHDVIANTKFAKYYQNEMDNNKDNIVYLIAYQKKALRLLSIGLSNQNVSHLLDKRTEQKKDLHKIKPQLQASLNKNLMRNKQIYKKAEIPQDKLPAPFEPPKQYIIKSAEPKQVAIEYESKNALPFTKLLDNQTKSFINQLQDFSKNRESGLESAYQKLQKNIQTIYNDSYVNYYLNLENTSKNQKGLPESLRKKIDQIKNNGGKMKLDMQISILRKNSETALKSFQDLRKQLLDEEAFDNQLRQKYGQQWRRPPSSITQAQYRNNIDLYEGKAKQADQVNSKLFMKYEALQKFIRLTQSSEGQIFAAMPQVQVTKFIQQNRTDFNLLKKNSDSIKNQMLQLDSLTDELKNILTKIDYTEAAKTWLKDPQGSKEAILQQIFGKAYKLIERFNQKAKFIEENAKKVGDISFSLNKKNKGDENSKKQYEAFLGNFNDVNNLFRELSQGTGFYTKLNDLLSRLDADVESHIYARKMEADQIQNYLGKKGGSSFGGPNLPSMYPNQQPPQNLGFYIPPPINQGKQMNSNPYENNGNQGNLGDMLKNLMSSKPSFNTNLFGGGNVFQSKYK